MFDQRIANVIKFELAWRMYVPKRTTGIVRSFDGSKGYGYIDARDGEDVFVYYRDIAGEGFQLLSKGEKVAFYLENTVRGFQATDVTRLN
jgi:CspA family cold shock protein